MAIIRSVCFDPSVVAIEYCAGAPLAEVCVSVTNRGSAVIEATIDDHLTVRPAGSLGKAIKTSFQDTEQDFADRLILLGETMASETSLELKVRSHADFKRLKTGSKGTINLVIELPKTINLETNWTGRLALFGERLLVRLKESQSAA